MENVKSCSNCAHAIFDAVWGEYKCGVYKHTILHGKIYTETDCKHHKLGNPKESKESEDYCRDAE